MRINSISTTAFSAQFAKDENTKSILREYATIDKSPELYKTMQLLKEIGKDGEISLNKNKYGVIVANSSITNKDVPIGTDLFALKDYTYKYKEYAQHSRLFGNDAVNIREKNKDGSVYRRIEQNLTKGAETGLLKTSIAIHDEDISAIKEKISFFEDMIESKEHTKKIIQDEIRKEEQKYVLSLIG